MSHTAFSVWTMLLASTCPICSAVGPAPCNACIDRLVVAPKVVPIVGLDSATAVVAYDEIGSKLVGALKYRNAKRLVPWLAKAMSKVTPDQPIIITWAPTTGAHRRQRGFDQAELLARAVATELGCQARRLLVRTSRQSQIGLSRVARQQSASFRCRSKVQGAVMLVDDVITTGATMSAAASALRQAGAESVHAVALSYTV